MSIASRFMTVRSPLISGLISNVSGKRRNESKRYYLGGTIHNIIEVRAMGHDTLASNMEANHWDEVIHCLPGNWQPFEDGDVLMDPVLIDREADAR